MITSRFLKIALFLGSSLLVAAVFLFTHQVIGRLSQEVKTTARVLARFCAEASFPATGDPQLRKIFMEVIGTIDFPIVITDDSGMPRAWRQIDVDPALVPAASIDSLVAGLAVSPDVRERIERVRDRVADLDRRNAPVSMTYPGTPILMGAVHFGDPPVLRLLRWMPYVSFGGVAVLLAMGLWGMAILRQSESRAIWVGMAKETAHQLGTPLSSLMGWVELLRAQGAGPTDAPGGSADLREAVAEIERDVVRLTKVVQRFSTVGSAPRLTREDVTPVVRDVVQYMRRRMPRAAGEVVVHERYVPVPGVRLNAELIEWALENLISNSLTALDKRPGVIDVEVGPAVEGRAVEVVVRDNGCGMTPPEQRRAFAPGYTTRRRGWGLGLPLARRVIEEYHGGRIFVRHSAPGEGTTMVIRLPF